MHAIVGANGCRDVDARWKKLHWNEKANDQRIVRRQGHMFEQRKVYFSVSGRMALHNGKCRRIRSWMRDAVISIKGSWYCSMIVFVKSG